MRAADEGRKDFDYVHLAAQGACLPPSPLEGSADLLVKEAANSVLRVDNCDFSAQSLVDTSHLEADDATTDNDHPLRNFVK